MMEFEKGSRLAGKFAIVTGAANGIGAATARLFAAQGAAVAITDVDDAGLATTHGQIEAAGGTVLSFHHDVSSQSAWEEVVAGTLAAFGRLDILANVAGIHPSAQLGDITLEDWNRILAVDLNGPFLGTQAVLPEFVKNGGGAIVNVSSVSAFVASGFTHYNAAKAGVRALTRSTAFMYAKQRIRANAVYPGLIETNLTTNALADPATRAKLEAGTPLPNFGQPDDIAWGILYLASDEAKFVTGSDLMIDGGRTLK
jgi:NAD(P)-dependent dehydrogenase (short-subunit alcohol dehydrogenase family)